jgi:sulfite exporter TauE/SafE
MLASLLATAFLMGLAGSPHCLAMCGAACAGVSRGCGPATPGAAPSIAGGLLALMTGRLIAYAGAGAAVAASVGLLAGWAERAEWMRPLWAMLQAAALGLGLWLLWRGRQPDWFEALGVRRAVPAVPAGWAPVRGPLRTGSIGLAFVLLPCGLLQSALVVAALSGSALQGALVMAAFALGSGLVLAAGPWLWSRLLASRSAAPVASRGAVWLDARWSIRLAGATLAAAALWAMWHGFPSAADLCIAPT